MNRASFADALMPVAADVTVKATVLLALAWLAVRILRRSSAAVRHRVWASALCGLVALPVASWWLPGWQVPRLPAPAWTFETVAPDRPRSAGPSPAVVARPVAPAPTGNVPAPAKTSPSRDVLPDPVPAGGVGRHEAVPAPAAIPRETRSRWTTAGVALAVWCAGVLAVLLPTLAGLAANEQWRRRTQPIAAEEWSPMLGEIRRRLSIRRPVELRRGGPSLIPLTWGVIRPVVLLPEEADGWPEATRRLVLLHELAHVSRFDAASQLVGRLAAALYWFHPLAWYGLHRLRLECEHACDDCVVQAGERPTDYARQLLDLACSLRIPRLSTAVAMARGNALEERMTALFDDRRSHQPLDRRTGRRLLAGSLVLVVGLATLDPRPPAAVAGEPAAVAKPAGGAAGRITGRVVLDGDGSAVEGAEAILLPPPPKGQDYYTVRYPLRRVTTGASGEFAFDGLAPGRYRVWAKRGRLTSRRTREDGRVVVVPAAGEAPGPVDLRLVAGVSVRVVVRDRTGGKPIPGATVHVPWSDFAADPTTDGDGRAVLEALRAESCDVEVWGEGFARASQPINLENGQDADLEFRLGPGGRLEGVVRDRSGAPLGGAGLSTRLAGKSEQLAYVETDARGRYRLEHLPRDVDLQISVSKDDFANTEVSVRVTAAAVALDVALEPRPHGGSVAGVVLDHKGRPVAGAELVNMGRSTADVRQTKTGPDGRFRLDNLYPSGNGGKEVLVRARGAAPKRVAVETGPADRPAETAIQLDAGHRIKGRVVDEKGRPLEGVTVYFAHGRSPFSDGGKGTTDGDGRFAFDSLPPDSPFTFIKSGYSDIDDRVLELDTDTLVTVTMVPAGVIVGKVVDAKTLRPIRAFNVRLFHSPKARPGEPRSSLWTHLIDPGQNYRSADGRFQFGDLVVGTPLQVTISAEGYEKNVAERVVVGRPGEMLVSIYRLPPQDPASLRAYRGQLVDARGKPVAGAQLRLIAARQRNANPRDGYPFNWQMIETGQLAWQGNVTRFLEGVSDGQGRFAFNEVPRGDEAELVWWGKGVAPGRSDHLERLDDQRAGSLEISMPAPARIVGTWDRGAFPGAARVRVSSSGVGLPDVQMELKADQHNFEAGDLAAGNYWVSLMSQDERVAGVPGGFTSRPLASVQVVVRSGETRRVEFKK